MNDKIKEYVFALFKNVPPTSRVNEAKEELLAGCIDKYHDLVDSGRSEEDAYAEVIAGIGDVNELLSTIVEVNNPPKIDNPFNLNKQNDPFNLGKSYEAINLNKRYETNKQYESKAPPAPEPNRPYESNQIDPMMIQELKKKRTAFLSAGAFLFIFGITSLIFTLNFDLDAIGFFSMFIFWAIAAFLIIYGFSSTKIENFNETYNTPARKGLRGSITSTMWTLTVVIYLAISFVTHRWDISWLIFMFAVVVQMVINLYFSSGKFRRGHLNSIIWTSCVFLYLFVSMLTHRWDITWIFFLITVCIQQIINLYITWRNTR